MRKAKKNYLTYLVVAVVVVLIILVGVKFLQQAKIPETEIISRNGLHWHPHLTITIKGEEIQIPADIGIGAVHNPVHTHDNTGTIHLEFTGLVTKEDIRLKKFFAVWRKPFNQNQILDYTGRVQFIVNGQANQEFGEYAMRDGDKIEIITE